MWRHITYTCPSNIISFPQCDFPEDVTEIDCDDNQIQSFQYLPGTVSHIYCRNNQINPLNIFQKVFVLLIVKIIIWNHLNTYQMVSPI